MMVHESSFITLNQFETLVLTLFCLADADR